MAKEPKNSGLRWRSSDVQELKKLAKGNTPTRIMGLKLGRTPEAVQKKANEEGVSLKPTNQRPYNRRKK